MHATASAAAVQRRLRRLVQQRELAATQPAVTESTFDQTRKVEQLFFQKFSEKYQLNARDIKRFFSRYDANKSGVLEENEFRATISSFLNGVTEQEIQLLLCKYDFNGDRRVSIEEFTEYLVRFAESSGDPRRRSSTAGNAQMQSSAPAIAAPSPRSAQHQRRGSWNDAGSRKPRARDDLHLQPAPRHQNVPIRAWEDDMSEHRTYSEIQYDGGDSLREQAKGALRNLRALLEQKASAQRAGMPSYDRLSKRSDEIAEDFGRKYMRRVFQKLGDGSTTLAFRDFITMLRKMQYPGQRSLAEEEMKFLYDLSNRGDCDALCNAIFDKERLEPNQFGFTRIVPAVTQSSRPDVGEGPFSATARFNSIAEVPMRLRYKFSKTRVCPPSNFDVNCISASARPPAFALQREYVFGMASNHAVGQPLYAAHHGRLVYCIAALGVSYDPVNNTQTFFDRHDDDITCIAINNSGTLVATGQMGKDPCVWVWDALNAEPRIKLGVGHLERAVSAVAFSFDSRYLFCISCDDHNMLCVFEVATGALVTEAPCQHGTPPRILQIACSPGFIHDGSTPAANVQYDSIVTVGKSHVRFWRLRRDLLHKPDQRASWLTSKLAAYGKVGMQPRTTHFARFVGTATASAVLDSNTIITGGDNGVIHTWRNEACVAAIQGHRGPVLSALLTQNVLYTGGHDGLLKSWNLQTLSPIVALDVGQMQAGTVRTKAREEHPRSSVRNAAPTSKQSRARSSLKGTTPRGGSGGEGSSKARAEAHASDTRVGIVAVLPAVARAEPQDLQRPSDALRQLYVLTKRGTLLRVDVRNQSAERCALSHFAPVFGVAVANTTPDLFATTGEDGLLCLWNARTHQVERRTALPGLGRSCDFAPDDSLIAVGMKNGAVVVYNMADLRKIAAFKNNEETIDDLKFSPNGHFLATGSHDNYVDIYDCRRDFKHVRRLKGHTSYVTHLDWSADSTLIQSNCGAYEILYWDVAKGRQLLSSTDQVEADTNWHTNTCVLGFPVMGIWPRDADGTDINALHALPSRNLVVTADDFGGVNLLTYPCVVKNAPRRRYGGHSSHVMNVRAPLRDPSWVVSVGGNDRCAQLWRIVPHSEPSYNGFDDGMSGTTWLC